MEPSSAAILMTTIAASILIGLCGGVSFSQKIELHESQLQIRSMQTRAFNTKNKNKTLRAIATLNDLRDMRIALQVGALARPYNSASVCVYRRINLVNDSGLLYNSHTSRFRLCQK